MMWKFAGPSKSSRICQNLLKEDVSFKNTDFLLVFSRKNCTMFSGTLCYIIWVFRINDHFFHHKIANKRLIMKFGMISFSKETYYSSNLKKSIFKLLSSRCRRGQVNEQVYIFYFYVFNVCLTIMSFYF